MINKYCSVCVLEIVQTYLGLQTMEILKKDRKGYSYYLGFSQIFQATSTFRYWCCCSGVENVHIAVCGLTSQHDYTV